MRNKTLLTRARDWTLYQRPNTPHDLVVFFLHNKNPPAEPMEILKAICPSGRSISQQGLTRRPLRHSSFVFCLFLFFIFTTHASLRTQIQHKAGPNGVVGEAHRVVADVARVVDDVSVVTVAVVTRTEPPERSA